MTDSTDPPIGKLVQFPTNATDPSMSALPVYVCGTRRDKCVCIENHADDEHPIVHWCHQCGDEWRDEAT